MPSAPARILVVDDDQTACTALAKFLVTEGFDVTTASDGESALAEAKRDLPDLVITDLTMPRMGGIELCGHIHALDPELPLLIITATPDTSSAVASLRAGADDYLTKPVDLDALLHRIERTLERRRAKNEVTRLREEMRSVNERLVLSSIREQQNAEAADRAHAQLNSLLENLSDGVLIADRHGHILMTNRAAHEMWLSERVIDDVHQLDPLQMLHADGTVCPLDERPLARALRGEVVDRSELLCVRGDAETRRLLMSGTNVRDAAGNVDLAIVVFSDVTDLRRLERQREEYLALIAHDLRGPLNTIVMSADFLKHTIETKMQVNATPILERLAGNALRMNAMIEELLESTTLESQRGIRLVKRPCDLQALVTGIIDALDDASRRRIVLETNETTACVLAEPQKIERAITNIISNALKYSPKDAMVRVVLGQRNDDVVLEVVDHGLGIAAAHVPRLFERYYRAPTGGSISGLGLGLYIAGLIIEAHGGRIEVASNVGTGSTFTLFLPLYPAPCASETSARTANVTLTR